MPDVSTMFQWLNAHPELAGIATFLISAAESIAIIGTVVPGSITMTAIGALAGAGIVPLWSTLLWAIFGAVAGDGVSYWLGHHFKGRLPKIWPFRYYPNFLDKGEKFFKKYGGVSVFFGRFVGPVRALVPLVAGTFGMPPLRFTIYNVSSAIFWAPAYMLPGILLGAASLELPPDIAFHVVLVLLFSILFTLLILWLIYQFLLLLQNQINNLLSWVWEKLKKSRFFSITTVALKHHDPHKAHGQLILAFYFLLTSTALVILICIIKHYGSQNLAINNAIFHLFRSLRSPTPDNIMLMITFLGQKQIVLSIIAVLGLYFMYLKRWRIAIHTFLLGIFAAGSIFVIKNLVHENRPWGILHSSETYSFPSGHVTLATIGYMGIAMIIASALPVKWRKLIYFFILFIIFLISLSRLYLGAHWFTDVLGAGLLSTAILMLITLSFNRKKERLPKPGLTFFVAFLTLLISYGFFYTKHIANSRLDYMQMDWPSATISSTAWWNDQQEHLIPEDWVNLFGIRAQRINVQWVGDLTNIKQTLQQQGWSPPPEWAWSNVAHRVMDIESSLYIPLVAPRYLDKPPALVMIRQMDGAKRLYVLRLWDSNRTMENTHLHLWVGTLGVVPRTYSWLFRGTRPKPLEVKPSLVFSKSTTTYRWKTFTREVEAKRGGSIYLTTLLIQ